MSFDLSALKELEARISAQEGINTDELAQLLSNAFSAERSSKDIDDYRLRTRPWKKLREEVSPVSAFLSFSDLVGNVRFPLDSKFPDAWFWREEGPSMGIEVTQALGRTDYELSKELVRNGYSHGFLGLQDNATKAEFSYALQRGDKMYSSKQALTTVTEGIKRCLINKKSPKYNGMWLLVLAPLNNLPRDQWKLVVPTLADAAVATSFDQIYVFCREGQQPWGFQIK